MKERIEIPYFQNSCDIFGQLSHLPWAIFLDSCGRDRFDIMSACPYQTIQQQAQQLIINSASRKICIKANPFLYLKSFFNQFESNSNELPFADGLLGYWGYELNQFCEQLPAPVACDLKLPELALGCYSWSIVVDHQQKKSYLQINHNLPAPELDLYRWADQLTNLTAAKVENFLPKRQLPKQAHSASSNFTYSSYKAAFEKIKTHLLHGDCYQINLAQRWKIPVATPSWQIYQQLRQINPAQFAAFLNLPQAAVLSFSPERFLRSRDRQVLTSPIKGTCPRSLDPIRDAQLAAELQNSSKNQAENVMIVDLLRNDLAKTCLPGSIAVPKLFDLESNPAVHHLVSHITGQLKSGIHPIELLHSCFPGGSITGAPKKRAMEIIQSLEPHRRTVYCGNIGYLDFSSSNLELNIAIRSLVLTQQQAYLWAGGGIVFDSDCAAEYQETLDKIKPIKEFLEQL